MPELDSIQALALLQRYREGSASPAEIRWVEDWFARLLLTGTDDLTAEEKQGIKARMAVQLMAEIHVTVKAPVYKLRRFFQVAVAACLAALILVGGYFMFFNNKETGTPPIVKTTDIEAPKSDKAVIRFNNGKLIAVDTLTSYSDGNVTVTRMADGRLVYAGLGTEIKFNTLSNPRGSKVIDMTLADGSRVWLNAGSSITYPVSFVSSERKVNMTGEAYFEVAKDASKKFIVIASGLTTEVIGTHFNINTYTDEAVKKVTLLEGSIMVNGTMIKPGQQAQVGHELKVSGNIDLDAVMAWRNGYFHFSGMGIQEVMRQLERWYDITVSFEGKIPERKFAGQIDRNANLSEVIRILRESNVHFTVKDRHLIVTP